MKLTNGKQSIDVSRNTEWRKGLVFWRFCQNEPSSTGFFMSVEQFDMLKEMVNHPAVVELYESIR